VQKSPVVSEPKIRKYYPKDNYITVRIDNLTYSLLENTVNALGMSRSKVIRSALWLIIILLDSRSTLRKILKKEAIEALMRGEDVAFVDALKPIDEIVRELGIVGV